MTRDVELAVRVVSSAAPAGLDATADAAKQMARDVEAASRTADSALDRVGASADDLDSKAGRATGALGALSSGFELVGAEKYAGALQAAALATDFASGAGQAMTLILELESVQRIRATAMTIAHNAATMAAATASKVAAAGQWALNAAMSANPVGLVVLAVVALVAAFVLAYKRSETFRAVVQGVMAVVGTYISTVVTIVRTLVSWVVDRAGPAFAVLREAVATAMAIVQDRLSDVRDTAKAVFDKIRDVIANVMDGARDKISWFVDQAKGFFDALMAPINKVKDAIGWVVDKLGKVKVPRIFGGGGDDPGFNPGPGFGPTPGPGAGGPPPIYLTLNVNVDGTGGLDPAGVARYLADALTDALVRTGREVVTA